MLAARQHNRQHRLDLMATVIIVPWREWEHAHPSEGGTAWPVCCLFSMCGFTTRWEMATDEPCAHKRKPNGKLKLAQRTKHKRTNGQRMDGRKTRKHFAPSADSSICSCTDRANAVNGVCKAKPSDEALGHITEPVWFAQRAGCGLPLGLTT